MVNSNKWLSNNLLRLAVLIAGIIAAAAVISASIRDMKPKVELNTQHRHVYEEKVSTIEQRQEEYHKENLDKLEEVIDLLEK